MRIDNDVAKELRKDFPLLQNERKGKRIIYVDNSATTQKPKQVIQRVVDFYENSNANVGRGIYSLSQEATDAYEEARRLVEDFINAEAGEVVFTSGSTESINILGYGIWTLFGEGRDKILLTELEHHANLVPWQELARRNNYRLEIVRMKEDYTLDMEDLEAKLDDRTALLSFTMVSNALGTKVDAKRFTSLAKEKGVLVVIDAAQAVPHQKIDVKDIGCDFLAFSGHKMLSPTAVGVLYGRKELLKRLPPSQYGGHMIQDVEYDHATWADPPARFEAGTASIEGAVCLGEAVRYLNNVGLENIEAWEHSLLEYALKKLGGIPQVEVYNAGPENSAGILSFNIKGVHPHDVSSVLDDYGVCVRAGHHCAMPLMKKLGVPGTVRASFYLYNTREDVDALAEAINGAIKIFHDDGSGKKE